jgi:hypothetical protein
MSEKDWIRGPLWKDICQFLDISPEGGSNGALALYERVENLLGGAPFSPLTFSNQLTAYDSRVVELFD